MTAKVIISHAIELQSSDVPQPHAAHAWVNRALAFETFAIEKNISEFRT